MCRIYNLSKCSSVYHTTVSVSIKWLPEEDIVSNRCSKNPRLLSHVCNTAVDFDVTVDKW